MNSYLSLKTLSRALVDGVGGLLAAESVVRLSKTRLADCYDPRSASYLPVDVVARLEEVAQQPLITRELALRAGCVLIPIEPQGKGRLPASMADFARETGETFATFADAMADGRADAAELADLRLKLGRVMAVTHAALTEVEQQLRTEAQ